MLLLPPLASGEIAVVVHPSNPIETIEKSKVTDLFMGRVRSFDDGSFALPIDQAGNRENFYQSLTNRDIQQINAYWARIMFSGQASPPLMVPDDEAVLRTVRSNEGAIGYIDASYVDDSVRVIFSTP